jgi:hypothetical protein
LASRGFDAGAAVRPVAGRPVAVSTGFALLGLPAGLLDFIGLGDL